MDTWVNHIATFAGTCDDFIEVESHCRNCPTMASCLIDSLERQDDGTVRASWMSMRRPQLCLAEAISMTVPDTLVTVTWDQEQDHSGGIAHLVGGAVIEMNRFSLTNKTLEAWSAHTHLLTVHALNLDAAGKPRIDEAPGLALSRTSRSRIGFGWCAACGHARAAATSGQVGRGRILIPGPGLVVLPTAHTDGSVSCTTALACSAKDARALLENPPAAAPVGLSGDGVDAVIMFAPEPPPPRPFNAHERAATAFERLDNCVFEGSEDRLVDAMRDAAAFGIPSVDYAVATYLEAPLPAAFVFGNVIGLVRDEAAVIALIDVAEKGGSLYLTYQATRALAAMGGPIVESALQYVADGKASTSFVHDIAMSTLALVRHHNLYAADPATFTDELLREIYAPWDEMVRLDAFSLRDLAQPLECLDGIGVLGHDPVSQTVWRVICAERHRRSEANQGRAVPGELESHTDRAIQVRRLDGECADDDTERLAPRRESSPGPGGA